MICLVSGALPSVRCGVGDYTHQLARALARAGHEVVVVTTAHPRLDPDPEYRIVPLETDWSLRQTARIAAAIHRLRPDAVDIQYPGVNLGRAFAVTLLPLALRLSGSSGTVVHTVHEFASYPLRHRIRVLLGAAPAHVVLAVDGASARALRRDLRWRPHAHVELAEIGPSVFPVDTARPAELRRTPGELIVGHWGFLRPDKGLPVLLDAFAIVRRSRPARLVVAGDPGGDIETRVDVERRIAELGLDADVLLTGELLPDAMSATLLAMDVCAFPFRDGLTANRTTYLAAVAHGIYVATTSRERSGFDATTNTAFSAPGDVEAMARSMLAASEHPRMPPEAAWVARWDAIAQERLRVYGLT